MTKTQRTAEKTGKRGWTAPKTLTQVRVALKTLVALSVAITTGCHSQQKIVVLSSSDQAFFQATAQASKGDITTLSPADQARLQKIYGAQAGPMIKYQYLKMNH